MMNRLKSAALLVFLLFVTGCATPHFALEAHTRGPTIDILSTPIDTLREKLTGKTSKEVIALVGEPHQHAIIMDHDAWVYVQNGTTTGKSIIFDDNERVMTVKLQE